MVTAFSWGPVCTNHSPSRAPWAVPSTPASRPTAETPTDPGILAHPPHPGRRPALLGDAAGLDADRLAVAGDQERLVARPRRVGAGPEAPAAGQLGGDDALAAPVLAGVVLEVGALAVAAV